MHTKYTLGHHDGWLCVIYETTSFSEPEYVRLWWPVVPMSETEMADRKMKVGDDARDAGGDGLFYTGHGTWVGAVTTLRLKDGNQTQPIHVERVEIPRPKTRCETRYHYGYWEKHLKAKGWVKA